MSQCLDFRSCMCDIAAAGGCRVARTNSMQPQHKILINLQLWKLIERGRFYVYYGSECDVCCVC